MSKFKDGFVMILVAVFYLATLAVLVSNSTGSAVLTSIFNALTDLVQGVAGTGSSSSSGSTGQ